ncbi:MAG: hypothetical protein IT208_11580 [Chthonomonadales bacterium]|nr:hypothetical protein [Chthonomonadales bacterium]
MSRPRLYDLLPAVYRVRDSARGEPLRALLSVLDDELDLVEGDIARLYDNWFIETCEEWVVPYIGDLLGVRNVLPTRGDAFSQRALVANTLAYRRGKGTAATLEQVARDVTGWPARVVEFWQRLATTQAVNHVRLENRALLDTHDADAMERVGGAFEMAAHLGEVRHVSTGQGRYNVPDVDVFLWTLQSYALSGAAPRPITDPPDGRYTFSPLGLTTHLFNRPRSEASIARLAAEVHVPGRLRRRPLDAELALGAGARPPRYFDEGGPVFEVLTREDPAQLQAAPIALESLVVGDLSDDGAGGWPRPPAGKRVAVDPVLGRLAFRVGEDPLALLVSYAYGGVGEVGGGPYSRRDSLARWFAPGTRPPTWQVGVTRDPAVLAAADPEQVVGSLREAIARWHAHAAGRADALGIVAVMDSDTYREGLSGADAVEVAAGRMLAIVAADWPEEERADPGSPRRLPGRLAPDRRRPHLRGDLEVRGTAPADSVAPGMLVVDGLLVEGAVTVLPGNLGALTLAHVTVVPGLGGLAVRSGGAPGQTNSSLRVSLYRAICGAVDVADDVARLDLEESIVDAGAGLAVRGPDTRIESCTVRGRLRARTLSASNSILAGLAVAERRQEGCVRFSYLAPGSLVPRRYRCQPADGASGAVAPAFRSTVYGDPAYMQLSPVCPPEIAEGSEDEGEMGVYHFLQRAHRLRGLRASMDEYLRVGLEAGIIVVD